MAYTINRRIAELIDANGQLTAGKISADYITTAHIADNTLTAAQLHTSFVISSAHIPANTITISHLAVTDGTANQVLKTDGSGQLSFTTIETNSISQGNTNVTVSDTGTDGKITMTTEGTARWEVTSTGHLLPIVDNTYDIGSANKKVRDIYVSTGSIKMGTDTVLSINSDGDFEINDASGDPKKIKVDEIEIGSGTDKLILKRGTDGKLESRKKVNGTLQAAEKLFSITSHTTADITEGSNKFFTDARARSAISATGSLSYNSATGVMSFTMPAQNTSNITEGTNLYYTDARADARIVNAGSANWNTAYGWGNHASVGYTTTDTTYSVGDGGLTQINFTSADNIKLDGIATGANNYVLPSGYATETYVGTQISALVDSSPAALNTLNELAAALGDDPNFATTVSTSIGTKLPLAGGALTGAVTTNSTFDGRDVSVDGTKLDTIATGATNTAAPYYTSAIAVGAGGLTQQNFTTTLKTKLDGIAASANNYVLPFTNNSTNWNTAYGWGNHASAGYLTSYTDTNTTYSAGTGISLTGTVFANTAPNIVQTTVTGNAGTATTLQTARTINGVSFNGSAAITITANANLAGNLLKAVPSNALFTDTNTTYSVGNGGLTQINFTSDLNTKLAGIATSANYITNNNQLTNGAGYVTQATVNASNVTGLAITGLGTNNLSYGQTSGSLNGYTGWASHFIGNHGAGATYYMQDIIMPFWSSPQYSRRQGTTTVVGPYNFWTSENDGSGSGLDADTVRGQVPSFTDSNTTYTAGTGMSLSGTTFNCTVVNTDTNTTYSVGNGGLTEINFTTTLKTKLDGIATSANYITNNNQLTNGAGYTTNTGTLTSSNDRVYISDTRGAARAPSYYDDRYAQWDFQNYADTGVGGDAWHALLTVSKWASYDPSHRQEQLIFSGDHLWRRTATSDAVWGTSKKIWDSGNDGSGSGLDADLLDGLQLHTGRNNEANKVVRTDVNGYIQADWINTTSGNNTTQIPTRFYASDDAYLRYYDLSHARNWMGTSGKTSVRSRIQDSTSEYYRTGSQGWASLNFNDMFNRGSCFIDLWGHTNGPTTGHSTGFQSLHYSASNTYHHGMQMVMQDGNPSYTYLRGWWANGGTGYAWQKIWTDGNDGSGSGLDADLLDGQHASAFAAASHGHSYAPLTGGGTSGSWPISITGTANTLAINTNRTDGTFYQAMWTTPGSTTAYSSANSGVSIRSSAYGAIGFNNAAWYIEGNASYGLYTNTGFYAAGGLYDVGNRVYSAGNPQVNISGSSGSCTGTASNATNWAGLTPTRLFNNMGNNHSTYTDFNSVPGYGAYYIQAGTNGPTGVTANQFYGFTLGLGNDYPTTYGTQIAWPRRAQNGETYIYIRDREGTAWAAWTKIRAGIADSATTASSCSGNAATATTASNSNALGGYANNQTGGAYTIVQREANGYIQNSYFYTSGGGSERGASGMGYFAGFNSGDYYIRSYTNGAAASIIQSAASGSWNVTAARATRANGSFYMDDNYGNSIIGVYASTRYQGVYSMGSAYVLPADGTTTGNLYGLAWSHPNAGGAAGNLTDHGLLVINNGVFKCAISNSIVASGNITAYSDERLKKNWRNMPESFVSRLAEVRVGIYDRIDEENGTQVGVSAQSLQVLLPEAIITAKDDIGTLSVNYGGAALASAVELAKVIVEQEKRIERLERLIEKLTGETL